MIDFKTHIWICSIAQVERVESQIVSKDLGASKPKGLHRIAKIVYGHLCLREENLSFINNYSILGTVNYLCLLMHRDVQHTLCFWFVFLCLVYPMLPVFLNLIAPSVFSNVYDKQQMYIINHVSAETLTTRRMLPSGIISIPPWLIFMTTYIHFLYNNSI